MTKLKQIVLLALLVMASTATAAIQEWRDSYSDQIEAIHPGAKPERVWLYKLADAYEITTRCVPADGGSIVLEDGVIGSTAQAGETVTFAIKLNEEFHLSQLTITSDDGESIEPSFDEESGLYSFTMPASAVTITAQMDIDPIPFYQLGDVNNDHTVNIVDVTVLIDYLLGGHVEQFNYNNADVSRDGAITIIDVTRLIDLLLSN